MAAAGLCYAALAVGALWLVVSASSEERATLILASVIGLMVGLVVALAVGLLFLPAYAVAARLGGGGPIYPAWGAALFGLAGWLLADSTVRADATAAMVLLFAAAGALEGIAFWLGERRASRPH